MFSSSCDVELEELMKNIDLAVQDKCESLQKEVRIAMENLRAKDLQITRLKKELESGQKLVKILNEKIHKMESDRRLETIRNKMLTEVKSRDVEEEENVNIYKLKQELALAKGETSIKDAKIRHLETNLEDVSKKEDSTKTDGRQNLEQLVTDVVNKYLRDEQLFVNKLEKKILECIENFKKDDVS